MIFEFGRRYSSASDGGASCLLAGESFRGRVPSDDPAPEVLLR
jgi:hypothetical protein